MTKVLFIAYHFPPVGGAGVQRAQKFVQYLPSEGFLPLVVTGPGPADNHWTPRDATLMSQIPANVSVYRVEGPLPAASGSVQRRLENSLALPSSFSKWWIRSATELSLEAGKNASLVFATMSPFQSAEVASTVSQRLHIPWVADLRDPWALDEMQIYPTLLHRKLEAARMQKLLSTAALIVMNTPEATAALRAAFPSLDNKEILTITNGFDREDFAEEVIPRADLKFRIVHTGYLHTESGLQLRERSYRRWLGGVESGLDILTRSHVVLIEAIERWSDRQPDIAQDLEIVFAGITSREDRALAENSRISNLIHFTGYLCHSESIRLIRTADLLFLPMHNLPRGKRSKIVPGKTYEYMASGRPILAAVPDGDARDFLSQSGASVICRPDDVLGMIEILDQFHTAWKSRQNLKCLNESFICNFERRKLTRALAKGFATLLANGATGARPARVAEVPDQLNVVRP